MRTSLKVAVIAFIVVIAGAAAIFLYGSSFTTNHGATSIENNSSSMKLPPGTIKGAVLDKDNRAVSGATVSLYNVTVIDSFPFSNGLSGIANNPQATASDGVFTFEGLPPGYYNITAEKGGHMWFTIANLTDVNAGGVKLNVVLPDYAIRASNA